MCTGPGSRVRRRSPIKIGVSSGIRLLIKSIPVDVRMVGTSIRGLFHRQITRRLPLTQEMNSQHRRQWIGRKTFLARRGRVGLDQATQRLPEHHFHLIQELLSLGPLLGRSELVIGEAKLVTAHQSRLCIRLQAIIPRKAVVLQSPPRARLDYPSPWRGAAFMTVRSLSAS